VPRTQIVDAAQFLWRWELAGHQRDHAAWEALERLAGRLSPHAAFYFTDWHTAIADASAGDSTGLDALVGEMDERARIGRYPEGGIVQETARGLAAFAAGDWANAINRLSPLLAETERLAGSRAQLDLIEFTVLRACVEAAARRNARRTRQPSPPYRTGAGRRRPLIADDIHPRAGSRAIVGRDVRRLLLISAVPQHDAPRHAVSVTLYKLTF
jgi:hypothetical protein